ncbi:MAG TPA: cupin domain-containing protein [Fimbriimonadaceae bacterium]|nr:cupin domain-containing protein [Fimbriimonadaceae bacterium]
MIRHQEDECRWEGVEVRPYKEDGNVFKSVTRQTLFEGAHDLPVELRYFEVGEGGHSTLERHEHSHLVMVVRGSGQVLVGDAISEIGMRDLVHIPPMTWHQFRATKGEPLGFLCVVNAERDRPQRPGEAEMAELSQDPNVAEFIRS